jgi:hypothetical protein
MASMAADTTDDGEEGVDIQGYSQAIFHDVNALRAESNKRADEKSVCWVIVVTGPSTSKMRLETAFIVLLNVAVICVMCNHLNAQTIGFTIIRQVTITKPSRETSSKLLRPSRISLPSIFPWIRNVENLSKFRDKQMNLNNFQVLQGRAS